MRFIADLHIHSHYSRATSKNLTPEYLDVWAQLKGIDVVGTGDCTHPGWLKELKEKLERAENGLYRLKKQYKLKETQLYLPPKTRKDVYFVPTGEISSIYKKNNKVRKVHSVCVLPDFDAVQKLQDKLSKLGNITSDGRPILGIDAKNILEIILQVSDRAFVIPAHIWTPWFSVLGDKSGFNSIEECYEDLTKYIFAVETGLSSDPPMNWACSFLDKFRLISNSDAHSPEKLGREANIFDTDISYDNIHNALKTDKGFWGTIEFFPQEGKYHYDGHRKCNVCWDPVQTINHNCTCPMCGKPVTKGVMYRVAELADRKSILEAKNRKEFYSIISLTELISEIVNAGPGTERVKRAYFDALEKVGSEFYTLLFADIDEIRKNAGELLGQGIKRMRNSQVEIKEGYDGEFGRISVFNNSEPWNFAGDLLKLEEPASLSVIPAKAGIQKKDGFPSRSGMTTINFLPRQAEPVPAQNKYSIRFDIESFKKAHKENPLCPAPARKKKADIKKADKQIEAISNNQGVCMVMAGPGSGKTYVLTERIIRLIKEKNVPQEKILALTFSNKAAGEMQSRIKAKVSKFEAFVSTFHAFGLSILKKHYELTGRNKNFLIIDNEEKEELFKGEKKVTRKKIKQVSDFKQGIIRNTPSPNPSPLWGEDKGEGLDEYNSILKKDNAFDLDDLIYLPVKLLKENPEILQTYQKQYEWILVDEYQDINAMQYEMLRLIAGEGNPNLFVIGDPDQSIYGFRGSDVRLIEKLKQDYPPAKVVELSRSFRCPSTVLKAGGQVLKKEKYLEGNPLDIKIDIMECETEKSEADAIAARIEKMIGGVHSFSMHSGVTDGTEFEDINSFSDFAILCRTSAMFEPIVSALHKHGIAAQVIGTESFLKEQPFKKLIQEFKTAFYRNEDSQDNIKKMIQNKESISCILSFMIENIPNVSPFNKKSDVAMKRCSDEGGHNPPASPFRKGGIEGDLINLSDNGKRLLSLGKDFGCDYAGFFQSLTMRKGIDDMDPRQEAALVMTLHASKGLEFNAVFIPGCEQGIIPFELFDKKTKEELDEEKRLFYVGITRTKKYLFLSHAKKRFFKGRVLEQKKSSLLDELEENLINKQSRKPKKQDKQLQFTFLKS